MPKGPKNFKEKTLNNYGLKTDMMISQMPVFMEEYKNFMSNTVADSSLYAYTRDIKDFFIYLTQDSEKKIKDISLDDIAKLRAKDISNYLVYVKRHQHKDEIVTNADVTLRRILSSIKSLFSTLYNIDLIPSNESTKVKAPALKEHEIIKMDEDGREKFLRKVKYGSGLSKKQQEYHKRYGIRDFTIISLMLSTGIRISECVGLNMEDVDFKNHAIKIIRKGGNFANVYFSDKVEELLSYYMEYRRDIEPNIACDDLDKKALFLSSQRKRYTIRGIEYMVKKYAKSSEEFAKITPHKFRSTFGTLLYNKTKDLYAVSNALGHKSIEVAHKHYVNAGDRLQDIRNMI
ncbi:integrase [Clostridium sp. AM42-36]|jgi:integrase/recombinase XerC|nr:integrase [Clostridium sp. AM42-36]